MNVFNRLKQKFKKKQPIEYVDSKQFVKENIASLIIAGSGGRKSRDDISEAFLDSIVNGPDEKELRIMYIQYSFMDKLNKIV